MNKVIFAIIWFQLLNFPVPPHFHLQFTIQPALVFFGNDKVTNSENGNHNRPKKNKETINFLRALLKSHGISQKESLFKQLTILWQQESSLPTTTCLERISSFISEKEKQNFFSYKKGQKQINPLALTISPFSPNMSASLDPFIVSYPTLLSCLIYQHPFLVSYTIITGCIFYFVLACHCVSLSC